MIVQKTLRSIQQTILTIIEDKPRYEIPISVYKAIIIVSFCQIIIYLFSDFQLHYYDEQKLHSVFLILDMVSIVNIVNLKQSDTFSYAIYIIAMSFMVFYFIYVGCLTIIKKYLKEFNDQFQKITSKINEILNLYFTLFLNVFLSFYLEINCSLIFCSKKSMLSNMRHQFYDSTISTCTFPTYQLILGTFGLFLTLVTALLTNYYFRNYEFLEKNILKRKFTILYFSLTVLRVVITFIEFQWQNQNMLIAKHIIAQIFGIVSIVDYFLYLPYTDQVISKYYLNVIAFYQSAVTCSNFYFWFNIINGQEMFYLTVLLGIIFRAVLDQTLNFKYDYIMQGNWKTERIINNLDFYLEQIIQLGQQCSTQEEAKTKLYKIYKLHQINCIVPNCVCHQYQKLNMKTHQEQELEDNLQEHSNNKDIENSIVDSGINMQLLYLFVDGIFKWMFSQKCITQNKSQFQQLSLKYISFMVRYQNNPVRAYQELKILQLKNIQFSMFFEILSQIIEINIQNTILNQQEIGESNSVLSSQQIDNRNSQKIKQVILHNELRIDVLLEVEKLCQKYICSFLQIIDEKQGLWTLLQNGYKDIDGFQKDSLNLMRKISHTRTQFQKQIQQAKKEMPDIEICIQFQKLIQIFYLFVINDTVKAIQLDSKINELKKRDTLSEENQLKNTNLLKGEICLLEISLAENMGKILSKRDDKTAQFFGYSDKQDFLKINNINNLMPSHIGRVHNQIVKNYIKGKKNKLKGSKQIIQSFMKQKDGFIHPISIYFRFTFTVISNDFRLNGVILKENSQKDYIIFDRSGKVTGITKNLAKNILFDFPTLPSGEALIKRMNFLLVFPKIVKKLVTFRELILNDLQQKQLFGNQQLNFEKNNNQKDTHTRTVLLDEHSSSAIINSNLSKQIRKFMSFVNKKNHNSEYSQYDQLDLLDKSCLTILKQFEEQDLDDQNTNRSNLSSDRRFNKSVKSEEEKYFTKEFSKKSMSIIKQAQNKVQMKMKYNYSIQYRIIDKEDQKKLSQNVNLNSRNLKLNQKEEKHKSNKQKDVYFVICFKNIQISQFHKKQKLKNKDKFLSNLYDYLQSTTSIIPLSTNIKNIKFSTKQQSQIIEQYDDSPQNQKITNLSTQIIDFMSPNQQRQRQPGFSLTQNKMIKKFLKSIHQKSNNQQQKSYKNIEDTDDQFQDDNFSSNNQSSLNVSYNSNESFKSKNYEQEEIQKQIQNIINNKTNFSGEIDDTFPELDELFQKYNIPQGSLQASIDKNTQIKKMLQNSSLSSSFGKAFEVAVSEALIQKNLEKQQLNTQDKIKGNHYHPNNQDIDIYQPVTFRQDFNQQEMEQSFDKIPQNIRQKLEPTYSIQINSNLYNLSYQNLDQSNTHSQVVDNNYHEIDFSNRITYVENNLNDNQNLSFFSKKNIQQNYQDPKQQSNDQNLLNISARPILDLSYRSTNQIQTDQMVNTQIYLNGTRNFNDQYGKINKGKQMLSAQQSNGIKQNKLIPTSQLDADKHLMPSTENIEYQNISLRNSSDRQNIQDNSNQQDIIQEKIIANMLNKKGMIVNGKNSIQASVHSSRSSSSYAGFFLKDIILRSKVPHAAKNYKFLLILFFVVFLALNITNLVVIQSDIKVFSDNVEILRYPRKFLRAYGKAFFGYYVQIQMKLGFLLDTPDQQYLSITNDYIQKGVKEYNSLSESYSTQLTQLAEGYQNNQEEIMQTYYLFKNREQSIFNITKSLMYPQHLYYLLTLINEKSEMQKTDSFLYLRQNFFSFSQNVIDQVGFLINNTVDASNSLIFKFTAIIIIAIILIVVIALISLPIIKQINFYEEKIIMILTRINFEQSEVEKTKYAICKQLINIELVDWMSYNYFDIFSLSCQTGESVYQSKKKQFNSKKEQKQIKSIPKSKNSEKQISEDQSNVFQKSSIFNLNQAQESQLTLNQKEKHKTNLESKNTKNNIQSENIISSNVISSKQKLKNQNNSTSTSHRSYSNQILQARIQNQKLGIFRRFLTLFILASINCIYYICIIIFLNQSDDQIKIPVYMNQNSIQLHSFQTNFKIALSLLSFDQYIKDELWSNYSIKDLQEYEDQVGSSFKQVQNIMQSITQIIYGKNPFSSITVQQLKNIQEGKGCQYLQVYQCQPQEALGLTLINANNQKFLNEYPNILNVQKSDQDQLKEYFNGYAYKNTILFSFKEQDEIYDIYSSFINQSITQVSLSIQQFLQNYLIIGCITITLIIIISEYISWQSFFSRIQMMNLLLTMIPEEKLQEEATLHMIRQLHRM
ncbi:hypothetical protein ABPG74_015394 [Tetrahymena malaccensis]